MFNMAKIGDYKISSYQGGASAFEPTYGENFTGYRVAAGRLGAPTKPDTANQIQQVNQLLNQGIIPIEVGALSPDVWSQIPQQHFKELKRQAKLTGAKLSVHAPLVEPSGMGEQRWSEANRELAERQLNDVVEKTVDLSDKGGIPITIHSANIPGSEYKKTDKGKELDKLAVIERESGKVMNLEPNIQFIPGGEKVVEEELDPMRRLRSLNKTNWDNSLFGIEVNRENAERILQNVDPLIVSRYIALNTQQLDPKEVLPEEVPYFDKIRSAHEFIEQAKLNADSLFSKAYEYAKEDQNDKAMKALTNFSKEYGEIIGTDGEKIVDPYKFSNPRVHSQALVRLMEVLKQNQPNLYMPVEEFAMKKSSETFANVAFNAFEKHKDKAPKISIENLYPGMAFSMKKEKEGIPGMKDLILESKKKFVEKALEKGYAKSVAEQQADKIIGMTLDVGHLNIAKKKGFKDEDLVKEVEDIAKLVKHVHLTDNFGFSDSHLPPGMGNVPFKKHLETLEKAGVLDKVNQIVEAGGFVQHFQTSPLSYTLQGLGSPIYAGGVSPTWNQNLGFQQDYASGYGLMLPQTNYEMFGAGFSQLPTELGGQRAGAGGSRMSGRPME